MEALECAEATPSFHPSVRRASMEHGGPGKCRGDLSFFPSEIHHFCDLLGGGCSGESGAVLTNVRASFGFTPWSCSCMFSVGFWCHGRHLPYLGFQIICWMRWTCSGLSGFISPSRWTCPLTCVVSNPAHLCKIEIADFVFHPFGRTLGRYPWFLRSCGHCRSLLLELLSVLFGWLGRRPSSPFTLQSCGRRVRHG